MWCWKIPSSAPNVKAVAGQQALIATFEIQTYVVRTAPPKAPPVPYRFVGKLEAKNAAPRAFLAKGEALLIVSAGDLLDNLYKVESLGQTEVVLTYLPLNQRQSIPISGGQ